MTNVHSAGEFYSAFPERRINPFKPELRSADDGSGPKHIWGYASMFGKLSRKLGGFVERVDNRAFTEGRATGFPDVVCRFNHNDDFLLGTVNARTCLIGVDSTGLLYDVVPPSFRSDIIELMERGDVSSSSFAFRVPEGGDDWGLSDFNYPLRTLLSVDLVDVAPVTTPAYPDATSAVRSMDGAVRSLATKFDVEPAEIRSLLEANQGVKLFKRTDRPSVIPASTPTYPIPAGTPAYNGTYSTGTTANVIVTTPANPQEEPEMTADATQAAPDSPDETSEDRAAKASYADLETCGDCNSPGQYGKHCTDCGTPMNPDSPMKGKFCSNCGGKVSGNRSEHECGIEERTETPAAEEAETVEERTETPAEEPPAEDAVITEEVTNGHVVDNGEAQLAKLGLQRRQRIAQLQEKRFDPFLGTDNE